MQPKIAFLFILRTTEHLEFSLILQKWPSTLHSNVWVESLALKLTPHISGQFLGPCSKKNGSKRSKKGFFQNHQKLVTAKNKCLFSLFGRKLVWKSGLSFWISATQSLVSEHGQCHWALLAKIIKSAQVQVPRNGNKSTWIQKLRPLFHANIPPKCWKRW